MYWNSTHVLFGVPHAFLWALLNHEKLLMVKHYCAGNLKKRNLLCMTAWKGNPFSLFIWLSLRGLWFLCDYGSESLEINGKTPKSCFDVCSFFKTAFKPSFKNLLYKEMVKIYPNLILEVLTVLNHLITYIVCLTSWSVILLKYLFGQT